jgi:hypothetical protein
MKVDLFKKDGTPAGQVEVPDEVVSAANRVNTWLHGSALDGGIEVLCGVTLADPLPSMVIAKEPPPQKPLGDIEGIQSVAKRGFWWEQ